MNRKKNRRGGLGAFLNQYSKEESQNENTNVIHISIENIEANPKNFYGLRDVEQLASLIAITKTVDPLIVMRNPDTEPGKPPYRLLAGHRRKTAWQKLLDEGKVDSHMLPCIVKTFSSIHLTAEDGTEKVISAERIADAYLMFSNMGQRQFRSINERLEEVRQLKPFARDLFDGQPYGSRGNFRAYFAESFLNMSENNLQRLLLLERLTGRGKSYIDEKKISITVGYGLSTLEPDQQEAYLNAVDAGEVKSTESISQTGCKR